MEKCPESILIKMVLLNASWSAWHVRYRLKFLPKDAQHAHIGDLLTLTQNQSTHIPLKIIKVQSGNYLGEDDNVRFEDHYGRQ
jgi:hypothetical protein